MTKDSPNISSDEEFDQINLAVSKKLCKSALQMLRDNLGIISLFTKIELMQPESWLK